MRARVLVCVAGMAAGASFVVRASGPHIPGSPCRPEARTTTADQPADEGFVGISVRDTPDGVVVGWVYPGPAGGEGFTSTLGIQRGDNLDAVSRGEMTPDTRVEIKTAADFTGFTDGLKPRGHHLDRGAALAGRGGQRLGPQGRAWGRGDGVHAHGRPEAPVDRHGAARAGGA